VAARRKQADREVAALQKKGRDVSPVVLEGSTIAKTFWGKAWCKNLERYSDYANRMPRGRSYVRNRCVVDLRLAEGEATALVRGSDLYTVHVTVSRVEEARWQAIVKECAGAVGSVIELLQGKLSRAVMEVITREGTGLFPAPKQIHFRCSCPDSASLCKHVAATLYGVGARLDSAPELLFRLCGVDAEELVSRAAAGAITGTKAVAKEKVLSGDLASMFGIDLDMEPAKKSEATPAAPSPARRSAAKKAAVVKPAAPVTITGAELSDAGVPSATVQSWRKAGVLLPTEARGVYGRTPQLEERLGRYRRA